MFAYDAHPGKAEELESFGCSQGLMLVAMAKVLVRNMVLNGGLGLGKRLSTGFLGPDLVQGLFCVCSGSAVRLAASS